MIVVDAVDEVRELDLEKYALEVLARRALMTADKRRAMTEPLVRRASDFGEGEANGEAARKIYNTVSDEVLACYYLAIMHDHRELLSLVAELVERRRDLAVR